MSDKNIDWQKLENYLAGDRNLPLNEDEQAMADMMSELKQNAALLGAIARTDPGSAWEQFRKGRMQEPARVRFVRGWMRAAIAAAIGGIILLSVFLLVYQKPTDRNITKRIVSSDVDQITLLLPDNRVVALDTARGTLRQGMVNIDIRGESASFKAAEGASATAYNTILVPRGKKFELALEDGTRIWLNADSKLRFPVRFAAGQRQVELEGEGYFEVAHLENRPFTVKYHEKTVRVLGTRFNIQAYGANEAVTLLQGRVEWRGLNRSILLKPGQQVRVNGNAGDIATRNVKAEDYILWINNTLLLEQKSVKDLFDDIVRHYDVDVRYKGKIPDSIKFNGAFEFPATLDEMLSLMNSTGKVIAEQKDNYVLVTQKTR